MKKARGHPRRQPPPRRRSQERRHQMTLPRFVLILSAAYAGLLVGTSGGYIIMDLLMPATDPVSRSVVIRGIDQFIPAIALAVIGIALSRSAWARIWIWFPTLAGFVLGMGYHLVLLNAALGLFRIDERIPMLAVAIGWLHGEARRLFDATRRCS